MGYKHYEIVEDDSDGGGLSEHLLTSETRLGSGCVTPFAAAGFLSMLSFRWLNPWMRRGRERTQQDEDLPRLRPREMAETCYSRFNHRLHKRNDRDLYDAASVIQAIFYSEWKDIVVSGFYAMIKVLALSTGPLFLEAFIRVGEGNTKFNYECYVLALGLFVTKSLEAISEWQWSFRTRLIGLRVRSFLSAAIFRKQLRLLNTARDVHSPGEIVNYLQLGLALTINYYSIGMATFAALVVIVLTVVTSSPMAKLQHMYQMLVCAHMCLDTL